MKIVEGGMFIVVVGERRNSKLWTGVVDWPTEAMVVGRVAFWLALGNDKKSGREWVA